MSRANLGRKEIIVIRRNLLSSVEVGWIDSLQHIVSAQGRYFCSASHKLSLTPTCWLSLRPGKFWRHCRRSARPEEDGCLVTWHGSPRDTAISFRCAPYITLLCDNLIKLSSSPHRTSCDVISTSVTWPVVAPSDSVFVASLITILVSVLAARLYDCRGILVACILIPSCTYRSSNATCVLYLSYYQTVDWFARHAQHRR